MRMPLISHLFNRIRHSYLRHLGKRTSKVSERVETPNPATMRRKVEMRSCTTRVLSSIGLQRSRRSSSGKLIRSRCLKIPEPLSRVILEFKKYIFSLSCKSGVVYGTRQGFLFKVKNYMCVGLFRNRTFFWYPVAN